MAQSPTVSAALAIHIWHALAPDLKGECFKYVPKDANDKDAQKLCDELNADLQAKLKVLLPSVALLMCIYGVAYVRPHAEAGKGIVSFESSYHPLPCFVSEFTAGGQPAGYAGEYLLDPVTKRRILAYPWDLLTFKNPMWTPSRNEIPTEHGYNLLTKLENAPLMENLNRGTSFLEHSLVPWNNLNAALASLKCTRNNAAKVDRLIAIATGNLDPANGARFINNLGVHMKRNQDAIASMALNGSVMPSVMNHFIPVSGDGRGGITIDTQQTPSDINGIQDVLFHLKTLAGSLGVDATMLGWADQMSGGLGEGGWLQTSIQAAQRAEWIQMAANRFLMDTAAVHMAWKRNQSWPEDAPYKVEFNSLNTAIEEKESQEREGRANMVSGLVSTLIEIAESPQMANSDTLHQYLFTDVMKMSPALVEQIFDELNGLHDDEGPEAVPAVASAPGGTPDEDDEPAKPLFESVRDTSPEKWLPLRCNNRDAPCPPLPAHLYLTERKRSTEFDLAMKPRDFGSEDSGYTILKP